MMRIKGRDDSDHDFSRLGKKRFFFSTSVLDSIRESFAGVWLYAAFDESDSIEEAAHNSLQKSWDAVGMSIRNLIDASDESGRPPLEGRARNENPEWELWTWFETLVQEIHESKALEDDDDFIDLWKEVMYG